MTTIQKICYNGEILTDITSFTMVQNLFDKPEKANLFHLMNLESVIETLLFHEKIWIIGPTHFGHDFEVKIPQILNDLIEKDVIKVYSPDFCSGVKELSTILDEMRKLAYPKTIETLYSSHKEIKNDLKIYDSFFGYGKQPGSIELAKKVGITDKNAISLYAHLVRTNVNIKSLHELKKKDNTEISYAPHMARISLLKEICNLYENNRLPIVREIIKKMELSEKQRREYLNQTYSSTFELDIPILATIIFSQCKKVSDILDETLILRKSNEVGKFRNWCNRLEEGIYNNDIETIEKYDHQLKTAKIFEVASKNIFLKNMPQMDFSVGDDNITPSFSGLFLFGGKMVMKYLNRRDLIFLIDLKNRLKNVNHSKDEFEKVFGTKLKI